MIQLEAYLQINSTDQVVAMTPWRDKLMIVTKYGRLFSVTRDYTTETVVIERITIERSI